MTAAGVGGINMQALAAAGRRLPLRAATEPMQPQTVLPIV